MCSSHIELSYLSAVGENSFVRSTVNNDTAGKDDGPGHEAHRDWELGQPRSCLDGLDVNDRVGLRRVGQVERDDDVALHRGVADRKSDPS